MPRVAAVEWGKYCINVNCIIPTGDSPAWLSTKAVRTPEQLKATMDHYLIKRPNYSIGDPIHDVGGAVVFLASSYSDWITSRSLFVDGGTAYFR